MHDAGMLHRHVTIASVALNRSGNLATARLMGHPYNVDAGQGCAPLLPLPLPALASNGQQWRGTPGLPACQLFSHTLHGSSNNSIAL